MKTQLFEKNLRVDITKRLSLVCLGVSSSLAAIGIVAGKDTGKFQTNQRVVN